MLSTGNIALACYCDEHIKYRVVNRVKHARCGFGVAVIIQEVGKSRATTLMCFSLSDCFNLAQSDSFKRKRRSTSSINRILPALASAISSNSAGRCKDNGYMISQDSTPTHRMLSQQIIDAVTRNQSAMVFHVVDKGALRRLSNRLAEAEHVVKIRCVRVKGRLELLFGDTRAIDERFTLKV